MLPHSHGPRVVMDTQPLDAPMSSHENLENGSISDSPVLTEPLNADAVNTKSPIRDVPETNTEPSVIPDAIEDEVISNECQDVIVDTSVEPNNLNDVEETLPMEIGQHADVLPTEFSIEDAIAESVPKSNPEEVEESLIESQPVESTIPPNNDANTADDELSMEIENDDGNEQNVETIESDEESNDQVPETNQVVSFEADVISNADAPSTVEGTSAKSDGDDISDENSNDTPAELIINEESSEHVPEPSQEEVIPMAFEAEPISTTDSTQSNIDQSTVDETVSMKSESDDRSELSEDSSLVGQSIRQKQQLRARRNLNSIINSDYITADYDFIFPQRRNKIRTKSTDSKNNMSATNIDGPSTASPSLPAASISSPSESLIKPIPMAKVSKLPAKSTPKVPTQKRSSKDQAEDGVDLDTILYTSDMSLLSVDNLNQTIKELKSQTRNIIKPQPSLVEKIEGFDFVCFDSYDDFEKYSKFEVRDISERILTRKLQEDEEKEQTASTSSPYMVDVSKVGRTNKRAIFRTRNQTTVPYHEQFDYHTEYLDEDEYIQPHFDADIIHNEAFDSSTPSTSTSSASRRKKVAAAKTPKTAVERIRPSSKMSSGNKRSVDYSHEESILVNSPSKRMRPMPEELHIDTSMNDEIEELRSPESANGIRRFNSLIPEMIGEVADETERLNLFNQFMKIATKIYVRSRKRQLAALVERNSKSLVRPHNEPEAICNDIKRAIRPAPPQPPKPVAVSHVASSSTPTGQKQSIVILPPGANISSATPTASNAHNLKPHVMNRKLIFPNKQGTTTNNSITTSTIRLLPTNTTTSSNILSSNSANGGTIINGGNSIKVLPASKLANIQTIQQNGKRMFILKPVQMGQQISNGGNSTVQMFTLAAGKSLIQNSPKNPTVVNIASTSASTPSTKAQILTLGTHPSPGTNQSQPIKLILNPSNNQSNVKALHNMNHNQVRISQQGAPSKQLLNNNQHIVLNAINGGNVTGAVGKSVQIIKAATPTSFQIKNQQPTQVSLQAQAARPNITQPQQQQTPVEPAML